MRVYEKPPMFLASFLRFMAFRELLLPARLSPDFNIGSRNFTDGAGRARYFPRHPYSA